MEFTKEVNTSAKSRLDVVGERSEECVGKYGRLDLMVHCFEAASSHKNCILEFGTWPSQLGIVP
jgi:hypothetical protein